MFLVMERGKKTTHVVLVENYECLYHVMALVENKLIFVKYIHTSRFHRRQIVSVKVSERIFDLERKLVFKRRVKRFNHFKKEEWKRKECS